MAIERRAEERHRSRTHLAALIAGGIAAGVDPYRGNPPSNDDVAKRAWDLADSILKTDIGWERWLLKELKDKVG